MSSTESSNQDLEPRNTKRRKLDYNIEIQKKTFINNYLQNYTTFKNVEKITQVPILNDYNSERSLYKIKETKEPTPEDLIRFNIEMKAKDIELVASHACVNIQKAEKILSDYNGDVVNAIIALSDQQNSQP